MINHLISDEWHTPLANLTDGPNFMVLVKVVSDFHEYKTNNGYQALTFTVAEASGSMQAHVFGEMFVHQGDIISGTLTL